MQSADTQPTVAVEFVVPGHAREDEAEHGETAVKTGKKAIAHHEAGHAVVARVLRIGVSYATLMPKQSEAGVLTHSALYHAPTDEPLAQVAGAENDIKVLFAGAIAQQLYRPMTPFDEKDNVIQSIIYLISLRTENTDLFHRAPKSVFSSATF